MKNFYRCVFVTTLAVYSVGCSSINPKYNLIQQRQTEYLRTHAAPPLQTPAGVSRANLHDDYPIPNANTPAPAKSLSLLPPNSIAEQIKQGKLSPDALRQREPEENTNATDNTNQSASYVKNDTLMINQPIADAWDQVENAINKAGYKMAYKNQKTLTFYIIDIYATNGTITRESPIYQIHLRNTPLGVEISVTDNSGKRVNIDTANRVLDNLYSGIPHAKTPSPNAKSVIDQSVTPDSAPTSNFGQLMQSLLNH